MKYIKGKKTIEASEKAFNKIYKEQGFKPMKELTNNGADKKKVDTSDEAPKLEDMALEELKAIATKQCIPAVDALKKEELIAVLKETARKGDDVK